MTQESSAFARSPQSQFLTGCQQLMLSIDLEMVTRAQQGTVWDCSNAVLYELCAKYPFHRDDKHILAKVLLIGRTYAVAIERRKRDTDIPNDRFYTERVAPAMRSCGIDDWIANAKSIEKGHPSAIDATVEAHAKLTQIFREITGMDKRSLASKYLHFHAPSVFYIYDQRAVQALRLVIGRSTGSARLNGPADLSYQRFIWGCGRLIEQCRTQFGTVLSPRELDNLLLEIAASVAPSEERRVFNPMADCDF